MLYKIKVLLKVIASILVSICLMAASVAVFKHQSSLAFEVGVVLAIASLTHWAYWPKIKKET